MRIHTHDQLLSLLDDIVARSSRGDRTSAAAADFWTELLEQDGHPLHTDLPDENLVDWHERGLLGDLAGRRVLDLGCGRGRNSRWFAEQGASVDGVDIAADLLDAAQDSMPASVSLITCDVLRDRLPGRGYDLVYDSGCFHHLAPHRRETYVERVLPVVRDSGRFGIVAFAADRMEPTVADADIIRSGDVGGGIGYSPAELGEIFGALAPVEVRRVRQGVEGAFGVDFLNAALFRAVSRG